MPSVILLPIRRETLSALTWISSLSLKAKLKERIHIFAQFEALSNTEFDHVVSINKIIATTKVFDFLDKNGYDQPVSDSDDSQPRSMRYLRPNSRS